MRLDIPALIVPGRDHAYAISRHAISKELQAVDADVPVEGWTEATAPARLLDFLRAS